MSDANIWQDDEGHWAEVYCVKFGPFDSEDEAREFISTFHWLAQAVLRW